MVKKLIAVAVIFCSGCSIQDDAELKVYEELCKNNGGILWVVAKPLSTDELECKNGAVFTENAWRELAREKRKKESEQ